MSPSALRRQIGRLLIAGFDGEQLPVELKTLAREFGLGGVILFARNVREPEQVAEVAFEAAQLGGDLPAWVSVDQEGGRVARLKSPFTEWPPMATLGRSGDTALAERFARALARELRAVGISLDYAPVLDIHTNPKNPVIGDRALAEKAADVARLGAVIVRTLQAEGIAACGKHFPGHGDTSTDSHLELPLVEHPPDRLRAVEFEPFRAAIEAGVATIMTAHILLPALDEERPATLGGPRGLIAALRAALGAEGTLAMPSMTDDDDHPFDPKTTPCRGMGVVADTFWRLDGVLRSDNPHAFAAIGPHAPALTADQPVEIPHGFDSPVGRVYVLGGAILLLGVGHDANTTIHLAEGLAGVRYRRPAHATVLRAGKPVRLDYGEIDHCCERFALVDEWLESEGLQRRGVVGHAEARLVGSRDVVDVVTRHLREEETLFLHPHGIDRECDEARASIGVKWAP